MKNRTITHASKPYFAAMALTALILAGNAVADDLYPRNPDPFLPAVVSTFIPTTSSTWNLAGNWDTNMIPNAIDEVVLFNSPTAAQTVALDGAKIVGSLTLTNNTTNVWTLANGTGGPLTFDVSAGNASLTINGTGNVVNSLTAGVVLNDTLNLTINDTATTSVTGALSAAGTMSGTGGVIKNGDGRVSFATTPKTYTGATVINAGILRMSVAGEANATSSLTVNAGGQLLLGTTANGNFQIGSSAATVVTLNGDGPTAGSGALASNAGAGTGFLSNAITLGSNSTISTTTALALTGVVSGGFTLTKTGAGTLALNQANTYSGGTIVAAGTAGALIANNDGALGTGNVDINATGGVRLTLQGGLTNNYISDNRTLSLVDGAQANLNYVGTDVVGGLVLGSMGAQVNPGTYGSTASGAMFQFDAFFTGTGTLTLIPEPSTWAMTVMGAGLLLGVQRFRRKAK